MIGGILKPFLYLLSILFRLITDIRNKFFDLLVIKQYKSRIPVISIGNIVVGGSGKTPLVIFIIKELQKSGFSPVVISRGYRGKFNGPHKVTLDNTPQDVGDEPLLIHKKTGIPVVVSKDRVQGARFVENNNTGDIIILDDGFQHRYLYRDLDLVVVPVSFEDQIKDFIYDRILPYGRNRESINSAVSRADIIILSGYTDKVAEVYANEINIIRDLCNKKPIFELDSRITQIKQLGSGGDLPKNSKITAFCGVANPIRFKDALIAYGVIPTHFCVFPDHYDFGIKDIKRLQDLDPEAKLVCTEKDGVKLGINSDIYQVVIEVEILLGEKLIKSILDKVVSST